MTRILKLGGAVCAQEDTLDLVAMTWRSRPGPWVIVHGGGPQLDLALRAQKGPVQRVAGLRVTTVPGARIVQQTLDGIGADLAAGLAARGVPARHVSSAQGWFHAEPKVLPDGQTLGRVGTVTSCRARAPGNEVLVVTPVGQDAEGPLNINADEGALAVATTLRAHEMVLATDVPAVLDGQGRALDRLDPVSAQHLMRSGAAKGGMVPKLRAAMAALQGGVGQVCIGTLDGVLAGQGTRVQPALEAMA